ncbi:MAG: HAMP domain-containing sensor histidine kinase [Patescibacteria group bacterium]
MKLGTKINLVLVVVVVTILTLGFWIIDTIESKNIKTEVINNTSTVTDLVRKDVERMFTQISAQKGSLQEIVDTLASRISGVNYIEVLDTKGVDVATTRSSDAPQDIAAKLAAINEVVKNKAVVSKTNTNENYYRIEHYAPVFDGNNNIINIIETEVKTRSKSSQDVLEARRLLDLASASVEQSTRAINIAIEDGSQYLQKIIDDASQLGKINKTDEFGFFHDFVVLDTSLNVLANMGQGARKFDNDTQEQIQARRDIATGAKESMQYERIHEGHEVVVYVKPIKIENAKGSRIVGVSESHLLKSAYENRVSGFRVRLLGVGVVFTSILVIVLSIILERQVVGPIRRYSFVARKIADGDLSQKVEHTSNDEIGQFGDVFNSMVVNLGEIDRLKSDFISIAAHQLRTPLSGVKWVLKLLLDGDLGAINDDQKGMLKRGYETNEKMIQLVNDLLNVSRIENGMFGYNFEENDFMKLLNTLVENTELPSKERNVEVQFVNHAGDIHNFSFDPEKLLIAFQNIVDNAMKYTLPGGKVTIAVEKKGDFVEVKVSDSGVGIPKADIAKLFSKFFRASNVIHLQTDGSGLGLFIVKSIIMRHGGQIWVDSVEGGGTTFTIVVPVIAKLLPRELVKAVEKENI